MENEQIQILLVDDDEEDFMIVKDYIADIRTAKYQIDWCNDPENALQLMAKERYDVFLIDYRLGVHDGLELLKKGVAQGSKAPMILLTGQGDREVDLVAMRSGAVDYLVKSELNSDTLERSMRYAIERKKVEEKLRSSEKKYRALFNHIPDPIFIFEKENFRILDYNSVFLDFYQYSPEEISGITSLQLHPEEETEVVKYDLNQAAFDPPRQYTHRTKQGRQAEVEIHSREIEYGSKRAILSLVQDITEHKRSQAALARLAQELSKSNSDLAKMVDLISGDLLRNIGKISEISEKRKEGVPELSEYHSQLSRQVEFTRNLIIQVAEYWKVSAEGKDFHPTDLNIVFEKLKKNMILSAGKKDVHLMYSDMPEILADDQQIEKIFYILIGMLAEFSSDDIVRISINVLEDVNSCIISIGADNIIPSAEEISSLFELPLPSEENILVQKVGLQLAICQKITERHRGNLQVFPNRKDGLIFKITLNMPS